VVGLSIFDDIYEQSDKLSSKVCNVYLETVFVEYTHTHTFMFYTMSMYIFYSPRLDCYFFLLCTEDHTLIKKMLLLNFIC
jgi:hypothetical protein